MEKKTKEVDVRFNRKLIDAVEQGAAKIVVPVDATDEDVQKCLATGENVKIFLIKKRDVSDYDWEWTYV